MEVVTFSHTHWDREWYRTFQGFRYRLVQVVDQLLDLLEAGAYDAFLLDGQTVVLDDYLAIRPENAGRLRQLIEAGKLQVGPWFVLPDEFLVSGESLVRNLTWGLRQSRAWGAEPQIGYLPDMFGHPAQMPQILGLLGLKGALLWRGVLPQRSLWTWQSPDGTRMPVLFLPLGYYVTSLLENNLERLQEELETLKRFSPEGPWLYPNGGDHLAPFSELPERLKEARDRLGVPFVQGTPDRFLLDLPPERFQQETHVGELRQTTGPARAYLLPGILSSRMPLKQANAHVQNLLEGWAEPLAAFAEKWGAKNARGFLASAWRDLLLNHPHDSIGGCSIDEVHRDMPPRFAASRQLAEELIHDQLHFLTAQLAIPEGTHLIAFNPTPWPYQDVADVTVELPPTQGGPFHLVDPNGQPAIQHVIRDELVRRFVSEPHILPDWHDKRSLTFQVQTNVPAYGFQVWRLAMGDPPRQDQVLTGDRFIDNGLVRIEVQEDGTLMLKRDQQTLSGLLRFIDEGDAGDSYNFSPPSQQKVVRSFLEGARLIDKSPLAATLELFIHLEIPEGLTHDRLSRSMYSADGRITVRLTVRAHSPVVATEITVDNRARDHRLRVLFPCPYQALFSDTAFDVLERPIDLTPQPLGAPKGKERAERTFPVQSWASLFDGQQSLSVVTDGLPEMEVVEMADQQALAVTLLRCVGWLSRDDLATRGGGAGPHLATPEAQCLGRHVFRLWLYPHRGDWRAARVPQLARQSLLGIRHVQREGPQAGHLETQLLDVSQPAWVVSAVKPADDGGTVIRLYNPTNQTLSGTVTPHFPYREALVVQLDETPIGPLSGEVTLEPHQILTLLYR